MHDLVDLDWSSVESGRTQMRETGACELPGFVRPEALPAFVDDALRLAPLADRSGGLGTFVAAILGLDPIYPYADPLGALFGYDTKPDTMSSELLKAVRYGRVA